LIDLLMKCTLPSAINTLQPPGWLLLAFEIVASLGYPRKPAQRA
jgi:hypothetical protein